MKQFTIQLEDERDAKMLRELLASVEFYNGADVWEEEIEEDTHRSKDYGFSIDSNRPAMLREQSAYTAMKDKLVEQYLGQYVAIFHGQVVDHDADEVTLIRRVKQRFPGETVHVRQVTNEPERILHFRSPRLIRNA